MKIEGYSIGILGTNCYLIINEDTKQAVVIDPAACPKKLKMRIHEDGLKIEAILLTHAHFDHTMGIDEFVNEFGVSKVYVHKNDEAMMTDPQLNLSSVYTHGYTWSEFDFLYDQQVLELAGARFKVIHTPGHTSGGCCFYLEDDNALFSGDTLFYNSIGRTDFVTSSMSDMLASIREKLFELPDDTIVYPGHMSATKIGHEKKHNPYV